MIKLWEILVPCQMINPDTGKLKNNTTRYHRVWDSKVKEISGGLTIYSPSKGKWVSPSGETIEEKIIPVRIRCSDEQIEQIADYTLKYYNQEAVFYYVVSEDSRIKYRK